jgi:hypothetical protein
VCSASDVLSLLPRGCSRDHGTPRDLPCPPISGIRRLSKKTLTSSTSSLSTCKHIGRIEFLIFLQSIAEPPHKEPSGDLRELPHRQQNKTPVLWAVKREALPIGQLEKLVMRVISLHAEGLQICSQRVGALNTESGFLCYHKPASSLWYEVVVMC